MTIITYHHDRQESVRKKKQFCIKIPLICLAIEVSENSKSETTHNENLKLAYMLGQSQD